jgi:hypothetical protein
MTVMDNEGPANPSVHEPRVTGSPEAIWLVYGELEHDDTHVELCSHEGVTWCEDAQFATDVRYTRTDLAAERVFSAVAAEREHAHNAGFVEASRLHGAEIERLRAVLRVAREGYASEAATGLPVLPQWRERTVALIDGALGPNVRAKADQHGAEEQR